MAVHCSIGNYFVCMRYQAHRLHQNPMDDELVDKNKPKIVKTDSQLNSFTFVEKENENPAHIMVETWNPCHKAIDRGSVLPHYTVYVVCVRRKWTRANLWRLFCIASAVLTLSFQAVKQNRWDTCRFAPHRCNSLGPSLLAQPKVKISQNDDFG